MEEAGRRNSRLEFVLQKSSARRFETAIGFGLVMNLVPAIGSADRDLLWRYLVTYDPRITADADTEALARTLMEGAINFYQDFIAPEKKPFVPAAAQVEQLRASAASRYPHDVPSGEASENSRR